MKFRVGEEVRVVRPDPNDGNPTYVGKAGVVTRMDSGESIYDCYVRCDGLKTEWPFTDEELELVASKRRFSIGDRVRVVRELTLGPHDGIGKTAKITAIDDEDELSPYRVEFDERVHTAPLCYADNELEPALRVGDKVRVKRKYEGASDIEAATVFEHDDHELYVRYDDLGGYDEIDSVEIIEHVTTPVEGVTKIVGAKVNRLRLIREDDSVVLFDGEGDCPVATMTIAQFREMARIVLGEEVR